MIMRQKSEAKLYKHNKSVKRVLVTAGYCVHLPLSKKIAIGIPVYHMTFLMTSCIPVGSIPTEIGRLINLTWLELHNNKLTGKGPISKNSANGRPVYHKTF